MDGVERRLTTILAADVVGYSRLMGVDEVDTHRALKTHREELFAPTAARYHGRTIKLMGDGVLMEFGSVVEAVQFAVDVQRAVRERNATVPEDRRVVYRIGINLGDIIVDGDDIYGDGVNVAARLEALAEPGGICVRRNVRDEVRDKLDIRFKDLGEVEVKNIARPVRCFAVELDHSDAKVPPSAAGHGSSSDPPDKPSVAVLPFNNMSGDPEQEYFADGISEDVITDLSKVSGLFVIARNSSFAYKDQSPDIRQVCRDLGVRYVLEGSVRKSGRRVRINAQLIDGTTGGHMWAERYDRDLEDIFSVQDDVTREIVQALRLALTPGERSRRDARGKVNPVAYDHFLRARNSVYRFTAEAMQEARAGLEQAVALDPTLAPAYAALALIHCIEYANGWNGAGAGHLAQALALADKALAADRDEPQAYHALALTQMWRRNLDEAARSAEHAIELDPNFAGAYTALGTVLDFAGQHEQAIEMLQRALLLDPKYDPALQFLGRAQFSLQRYDDAEATLKKRLAQTPKSDMTRIFLASIYGHTGRHDEARGLWREIIDINPDFRVGHIRQVLPYRDPAWFEHFLAGLGAAGVPT